MTGSFLAGQNSTGGKSRLWRITTRGDDYLRTLLIQTGFMLRRAFVDSHHRSNRQQVNSVTVACFKHRE